MDSLAELFDKDPLTLTREDRDTIVKRLREARAQFELGSKTAGNMKKAKPKRSPSELLNINLDDLEI